MYSGASSGTLVNIACMMVGFDIRIVYAQVCRTDNLTGTSMFVVQEACRYHRLRKSDPVRLRYSETALSLV